MIGASNQQPQGPQQQFARKGTHETSDTDGSFGNNNGLSPVHIFRFMAPREFSLDSNIRRSRPSLPLPILPADVGYGRRSKQAAASARKRDGVRNGAAREANNGGDGAQTRGRGMDRANPSTANPPSNNEVRALNEDAKTSASQSRRSSTCSSMSPITEEPQFGQRGSSNDLEDLGGSSSTAAESRSDDETSDSSDGLSSAFSAGLDAMGRKSNVTSSTELDLWNQINSVPSPSSSPTTSPSGVNNVSLNDIAKSSRSLTVYEQSDRELNDQYVMGKIKQLNLPASFHSSSEELSHLPEKGRHKMDSFRPRQATATAAAYKRPRKVEAITEDDEEYARAPTNARNVSMKKSWQGDDVDVKPDFNAKLSSITIDPGRTRHVEFASHRANFTFFTNRNSRNVEGL